MVEARKEPPKATPATPSPRSVKAEEEVVTSTDPTYTPEKAKAARKAQDEARKADAEAQEKVGKINANLARDGASRRSMANTKEGKAKYFWCNMVPTQELTPEELEAVGAMKA